MANKILSTYAERLGLKNEACLRKAEEFFRIYQTKSTVKNLNDAAKSVFCLDLAATTIGISFNKKSAIQFSGLKKQQYSNTLHTLEKVLCLDKIVTISELCVQCSCTVVKETAENILAAYKNRYGRNHDYDHPQYAAAAVYTACRLKDVKIDKSQLVTSSQLKPSQWKELTNEFMKFARGIGLESSKVDSNKKRDIRVILEEITKKTETEINSPKKRQMEDEKIEDYEDWKKRILEESYKALEKH